MKADYNSLIYAYESNNVDILSIIADEFSIATEADANTPDEINASKAVTDTVKSEETSVVDKSNLFNRVLERVKKLIKKIGAMFDELKRKLMNRLRLLDETDKGFFSIYKKRKSMVKPLSSVKVISYEYNNQVLDRILNTMLSETAACFDKLRAIEGTTNGNARISEIINAPQGKMVEVLIAPYAKNAKDGQPTSIPELVKYLVTQYRGEKKEIVYQEADISSKLEPAAMSTKDLANTCNGFLKKAQEAYNKVKPMEYQIGKNKTDEKVLKLIASNTAKAATLYNAYSAMVHAYYELKLEQSLNYRIILKKFYQF